MLKNFQNHRGIFIFLAFFIIGVGLISAPQGARAHSQETSGDDPKLVFPVISDTQIGRAEGGLQRFENAFKQLNNVAPKQDAFVFIGDLTSHGYEKEYDAWLSVFNEYIQPQTEQIIGIGNHEYVGPAVKQAQKRFLKKTGMDSLYYSKVMKGYTFIMLGEERGYFYSKEQIKWLEKELQRAEQRNPNKPIFVFMHHPLKNTIYGTDQWYIDKENQKLLRDALSQHPQVILMAGHTHYPVSDPRQIYQNSFTSVNSGSIAYMWTESGYLQGEVPPVEVSNGLLVKVYDDKVVIKRRKFHANEWVGDPWVIETPIQKKNFKYTDTRDDKKPYFANDAKLSVVRDETTASNIKIQFVQARDNLLTHSYNVAVRNRKTNKIALEYKAFSEYYKAQVPNSLTLPVNGLKPATTYQIRVRAIDAFGNKSKHTLNTTAITRAKNAEGMKKIVKQFEGNGQFATDKAARSLKIHLTAINLYEESESAEKVVKHMKGFKLLLDHQKKNELISEKVYDVLKADADYVIQKWQ